MLDYPFNEHLMWIADCWIDSKSYEEEVPDRSIPFEKWSERRRMRYEERLKKSIDLAHALGLKCDSVGWCSLDMNRPDIDAVLERIDAFARNEGFYLRGTYTRRNADFDSEWYLLDVPGRYMSGLDKTKIADKSGKVWTLPAVRAYKIPKTVQVIWSILPYVNENFRNCCLRHGFTGVDFCWIRDTAAVLRADRRPACPRVRLRPASDLYRIQVASLLQPGSFRRVPALPEIPGVGRQAAGPVANVL